MGLERPSEYPVIEGSGDRLWAALDYFLESNPDAYDLLDRGDKFDESLKDLEDKLTYGMPIEGWGARVRMYRLERLKAIASVEGVDTLASWDNRSQIVSWRNFLENIKGKKIAFYSGKYRNIPTPAHINFILNGISLLPNYEHAILYEPEANTRYLSGDKWERSLVFPDEVRETLLSGLPVNYVVKIPNLVHPVVGKMLRKRTSVLAIESFWLKRYQEITEFASEAVQGVWLHDETYQAKIDLSRKMGVRVVDCGVYVDQPAFKLAYGGTGVLDYFSSESKEAVEYVISACEKWVVQQKNVI